MDPRYVNVQIDREAAHLLRQACLSSYGVVYRHLGREASRAIAIHAVAMLRESATFTNGTEALHEARVAAAKHGEEWGQAVLARLNHI